MLKKLVLLVFLLFGLAVLIYYDKKQNDTNRPFDKGKTVWHD